MSLTASKSWSSRTAFLLASIGAAVGLGNLWRFPFVAGENGGGVFVLIYIGFMLLFCTPLVAAELAMGRSGKGSALGSMRALVKSQQCSGFWKSIGFLSLLIPFIALSYYSVVASWCIDYLIKAFGGAFVDLDGGSSKSLFSALLDSPSRLMLFHTCFIAMVIWVIALGLREGLERTVKWLIPMLFIILIGLVVFALFSGSFFSALTFLFSFDFEKVSANTVLLALGQALFSVGLGVGALITYGAYLSDDVSLVKSALVIGVADTFVALLAGLAIFPFVFEFQLSPGEGPGLIFVTLPIAFGQMTAGSLVGGAFFALLFFAAFTSALAMLEPVVSFLEERYRIKRWAASCTAGIAIWLLGFTAVFSFNILKSFTPLDSIAMLEGKTIFDLLDFLVSSLLLPVNALLIALFAGWILTEKVIEKELKFPDHRLYIVWRSIVRYFSPALICLVFIFGVAG